jgi:hypothetical protein
VINCVNYKQRRDEKKEKEGEPFLLAMEDSQSHIYISSGNLIMRQVKYLLPTTDVNPIIALSSSHKRRHYNIMSERTRMSEYNLYYLASDMFNNIISINIDIIFNNE